MNLLAIFGAIAVGVSLGLTGGGGSILTVPVLVYLVGIPPAEAVGLSLMVVGLAAASGAIQYARAGDFHVPTALSFALSGMLGALIGAQFTRMVSPQVLMGLFGLLMLVVAVRMLGKRPKEDTDISGFRLGPCLIAGSLTGVLTGFLGVGGGVLLVPAMLRFAHLPMRMAAGTGLAVISTNSLVGWVAHLGDSPFRFETGVLFAAFAVAGAVLGQYLSPKLPVKRLRQGFAAMLLLTAALVFGRTFLMG